MVTQCFLVLLSITIVELSLKISDLSCLALGCKSVMTYIILGFLFFLKALACSVLGTNIKPKETTSFRVAWTNGSHKIPKIILLSWPRS